MSGAAPRPAANGAVATPNADQAANANRAAIVAPTIVIRNGAASIQVDSLEIAMKALQELVTRMGGYVGNTTFTSGAYQVRSAVLELKLPSARYEAAVGSLALEDVLAVDGELARLTRRIHGHTHLDKTATRTNASRRFFVTQSTLPHRAIRFGGVGNL